MDTIKRYREEKKKGKILSFDETATLDEKNIVMFASGSLGGKGRGLAFINTLIYNIDFATLANKINILTPITVIVGTNEFMQFISRNGLAKYISDPNVTYEQLRELFYRGNLSDELIDKIRSFVNQIDKPIAVRSSSTSEDSLTQPFAGVFDTYIVPNSDTNKEPDYKGAGIKTSIAGNIGFISDIKLKTKDNSNGSYYMQGTSTTSIRIGYDFIATPLKNNFLDYSGTVHKVTIGIGLSSRRIQRVH